jgi:DNA polymerase I-like protein with 3'-5' exonuclease and polymerase domains
MLFMTNKKFIHQRICIYANKDFDPAVDEQVAEVLRSKFNICLPQRASMNKSLQSARSDHEIIGLILQYRTMDT